MAEKWPTVQYRHADSCLWFGEGDMRQSNSPRPSTGVNAVGVVVHPPERRRPGFFAPGHVANVSCCCCCCCCLHSLGGLIGAAVASASPARHATQPGAGAAAIAREGVVESNASAQPADDLSAARIFWGVFAAHIVVALFWAAADDFVTGLVLLAISLPALQLDAAILTAVWLLIVGEPNQSNQLRRLGRIVLGTIVGTIAGMLLMVVGLFAVSGR